MKTLLASTLIGATLIATPASAGESKWMFATTPTPIVCDDLTTAQYEGYSAVYVSADNFAVGNVLTNYFTNGGSNCSFGAPTTSQDSTVEDLSGIDLSTMPADFTMLDHPVTIKGTATTIGVVAESIINGGFQVPQPTPFISYYRIITVNVNGNNTTGDAEQVTEFGVFPVTYNLRIQGGDMKFIEITFVNFPSTTKFKPAFEN